MLRYCNMARAALSLWMPPFGEQLLWIIRLAALTAALSRYFGGRMLTRACDSLPTAVGSPESLLP